MLYGRNDALIDYLPMAAVDARTNKSLHPLFQRGIDYNLVCSFTFVYFTNFLIWSNCTTSGTNLLCNEPNSDAMSVLSLLLYYFSTSLKRNETFSPIICQVGLCIAIIETTDMMCIIVLF